MGTDRARLLLPRRPGDRPRAGRARPRERSANEPSGPVGWELALAARARRTDARLGAPSARPRRAARPELGHREIDRAGRSGAEAIDRERRQRPRLEVAHEE